MCSGIAWPLGKSKESVATSESRLPLRSKRMLWHFCDISWHSSEGKALRQVLCSGPNGRGGNDASGQQDDGFCTNDRCQERARFLRRKMRIPICQRRSISARGV